MSEWLSIPQIASSLTPRERSWLAFQRLASEGIGSGCTDQWAHTGDVIVTRMVRLNMVEQKSKNGALLRRVTFFGALVANEILKTEWPAGFLRDYFSEPQSLTEPLND